MIESEIDTKVQRRRAAEIAKEAHAGQLDKTGRPYLEHCQRVAHNVDGDRAKTVAYLHDVLEKSSGWDVGRLRGEGFSCDIIDAVLGLTRHADETEEEFMARATATELGAAVKRADLLDNLAQALAVGCNADKYRRGLELLSALRH